MLSLLAGNQSEAEGAYERFEQTGARQVDYRSTIDVLAQLKTALDQENPNRADLIEGAIRRLDTQMKAMT